MGKKTYKIVLVALVGVLAMMGSCKNESSSSPKEYISTMQVVAQNLTTMTSDTFKYVNFNESRPNPPSQVDTIRLKANTNYAIQIILLNETPTPVQYMTDTIVGRADSHLMLYSVDPPSGLMTVKINDKDSKGLPLGMMSSWSTTDTTNGWLRLILKQQTGHKNGTDLPGSTVFEADYPISIR